MAKHMTLKEFRRNYPSNNICLKALLEYRISSDRLCFNCQYPIDPYYRLLKKKKAFLCRKCLKHFYPMKKSIFDHTHIPISEWFEIIFLFLLNRGGIAASKIHNEYGYAYSTAFRMLHSIRELMGDSLDFKLQGVLEIDEVYLPTVNGMGKYYNNYGRGTDHTPVLAIAERAGKIRFFVLPSTNTESILDKIKANVPEGTQIFTDSFSAYSSLNDEGFIHSTVNHKKEYVSESGASTNTCEALFSHIKRAFNGIYKSISENLLQSYLNEFAFRFNHANDYDYGFDALMKCLKPLSESYGKKNNHH